MVAVVDKVQDQISEGRLEELLEEERRYEKLVHEISEIDTCAYFTNLKDEAGYHWRKLLILCGFSCGRFPDVERKMKLHGELP